MRVGSRDGTSSASGSRTRNDRTPSSPSAATITQSAVCPSTTAGLIPCRTQPAPLRVARARTVSNGSPWPCSSTATVPRVAPAASSSTRPCSPSARAARVAVTADEKNGPGSGTRPICSRTMHISSSPAPSPGISIDVHPRDTSRSHSSVVYPASSSASSRRSRPSTSSMARRATSCRANCSASNVKSTVHLGIGTADDGTSVDGPEGYPRPVDFALAPEDERFAAELRAWLDEHLPGFLEREELDDSSSLSGEKSQHRRAAWQRELNEGRWAAANWPEEYGGRNATAMQRIIYSEIMAEYRTPGMFNTNGLWQIGPMIIAWGTEEQKARWLPSILDATDHWCQGFCEPDAGNDLANLRTTAILDGDAYVVNGQKIWISTAHLAKWGLFLLRTDPTAIERGAKHEGITAFILDLETPGHRTPADPGHGRRGDVQRGLLHRRPHPGRLPARRRG